MEKQKLGERLDRVDGRAKVTGTATYAADNKVQNAVYGFLVGSTIAKGRIKSIDSKNAEKAPGVIAVITHLNAPAIPQYKTGKDPSKPPTGGKPLRFFSTDEIFYYDQAVALVIASSFEEVLHAAKLVNVQYDKQAHSTNLEENVSNAKTPTGPRFEDYSRGEKDAYRNAPVKLEQEYFHPIEVHNPMELGAIIAFWEGDQKVTVYTKTQGVQSTQKSISDAFQIPLENVTVHARHIGGAFGMALRTWPYEIAAVMAAKQIGKPLKLVLHREQMFTNVGYRPKTLQRIGLGATAEGKLVGLTHEATANTSPYEEFTEATVNVSRFLYSCPNVTTRYKLVPLNVCTPIWMRGPGEATGCFALESAMDELAHMLKLDPVEFRIRNHSDKDEERDLPWSSKYVKECYQMGAESIGWNERKMQPGSLKDGDWFIGYGMGTGSFGAFRGTCAVKAILNAEGKLVLQCSVNDMGPGTATMMTAIASESMGIPPDDIIIEMGSTGLPPGPMQGGSTVTSTVGSAVLEVCNGLKEQVTTLLTKNSAFTSKKANITMNDLDFKDNSVSVMSDAGTKSSYRDIVRQSGSPSIEVTKESKGQEQPYSSYSFSVHFVKLRVHVPTGKVKIDHVVSCADAGTIISLKTSESQMIGGAVGGIGMALMEDMFVDDRFGRPINNNLADYHVPVNADIPKIDVRFVNKKDPFTNPMGSKGLGEIALVGVAPAIANAVFNATGKRIRSLPITADKILQAV